MKKYNVYVHTCPNGKRYVGCTTQARPERRWLEGKGYYQNKHFYSAIKKYGWTNIKHEVWELTCESEMYYAEKYLIAYYHTTESKFGYNHTAGGAFGCRSVRPRKPHSEETRRKISEAQKKRYSDPEVRKKLSEAAKKKYLDHPECRKKMSEALKKRAKDPEVRRKMSETAKKRCSDPEYKRKISEALRKSFSNPEVRKKMSEAAKKRCSDPEYRKHRIEACKEKWADPEYRKRLSEIQKNRPRISIKLPDGTVLEMTKQNLTRHYINKGKEFEYVS